MYLYNEGEHGYLDLLAHILKNGNVKDDRTGVGTRSLFGTQLHFDLNDGFPLLTTKKVFTRGVFAELAWLIKGETNVRSLQDQGVTIWDEWADEKGDLGPIYGKQWRRWTDAYPDKYGYYESDHIDQLQQALDLIRSDPSSRRIVVSAWNPADLPEMALSPCHAFFQFEVHDEKLSCHLYQRSADMFLGVPFNIASYAALTHVMANLADIGVGDLIMTFGDCHIYNNHVDQVKLQLSRKHAIHPSPKLKIMGDLKSLDDVTTETFVVEGYTSHPAIKAEVAV